MERLTFDEYGCLLALMARSRSEDPFTKVGGVALNKEGRILGVSYNGLYSGMSLPDWMKKEENRDLKSDIFIHCESNLCAQITKDQCHTICLTISPCIKCCQNIAALNIKRVVYVSEYKKCNKFKKFFDFYGIEYYQLSEDQKNKIKKYILESVNI
jgi:deoxycytidylate deaminase